MFSGQVSERPAGSVGGNHAAGFLISHLPSALNSDMLIPKYGRVPVEMTSIRTAVDVTVPYPSPAHG